jgi:hypothetical protein
LDENLQNSKFTVNVLWARKNAHVQEHLWQEMTVFSAIIYYWRSAFTIQAIIKLFSVNAVFFQN